MKPISRAGLLAGGLALATLAWAQIPKPENVVQVRVEPARAEAKAGAAHVTLFATIRPGFHVNSHKPSLEYLIPTEVKLVGNSPFALEKVDYPKGEMKSFGFAPDEELSIYEGEVKVPLKLRVYKGTPAGAHEVRLAFHYQACNDQFCLRPARREVSLQVRLP
ncbi:MAG: protein-disulfide reductase DsbD domain-containing protein [Terriglobia bacterium]